MSASTATAHVTAISTSPSHLPYYAARSLLRMFIAFFLSVVFTFVYATAAARSRRARLVLVPVLDILQSVPVLGFLAITITFFIALFPGSVLGLECASIFAIFTSQAWNMTFSMYHSLITQPKELDEAARMFRLTKWERFWRLDVPSSMIGLVWNGMMSFGGGWFFLAASEAISVGNTTVHAAGDRLLRAGRCGQGRPRRGGHRHRRDDHHGGRRERLVLAAAGRLRGEVPGGDVGGGRAAEELRAQVSCARSQIPGYIAGR